MRVLSLFDGISCGRLALQRADILVTEYFASEIDKYAIQISKKNFPDIIQLGDVRGWRQWNLPQIDLLIGGSPCQGFSIAGKGLNFDDPRSKLFFDFVDILTFYRPKYFLLENVKMKKEWRNIITQYLGVDPIEINSALVSAQNRKRLYWTNIQNVSQPEDARILLRDIIEGGEVDREKSYCIDANYFKGGNIKMYNEKRRRQIVNLPSDPIHQSEKRLMVRTVPHGYMKAQDVERDKYPSLVAQHPGTKYLIHGAAIRNQVTRLGIEEQLNVRKDEKSNAVVSSYPNKLNGVYLENEESFRKLTPIECERLQTLPDNYTGGVSNTQRYKMLGNAWTVDVIAHIFRHLP